MRSIYTCLSQTVFFSYDSNDILLHGWLRQDDNFAARRSALGQLLLWRRDCVAVCVSVCLVPKRLSRSLCDVLEIVAQPL